MRWTHLVTLMEAEATRQEQANDHPAAILLREGADALRTANARDELNRFGKTTIPMPGVSIPFPCPPVIGSPVNLTASAILSRGQ